MKKLVPRTPLRPVLVTLARRLLASYARAEKLAGFGVAALARKVDDAAEVARATGTSMGKAKAVVQTAKTMSQSDDLSAALQHGDISLDHAGEIAAAELVAVTQTESFTCSRTEPARRGSTPSNTAISGLGSAPPAVREATAMT
jgi:hypothetical protein